MTTIMHCRREYGSPWLQGARKYRRPRPSWPPPLLQTGLWLIGICLAPALLQGAAVTEDWVLHIRPPLATNLFESLVRTVFDASGNVILAGNTDGGGNDTAHMLTVKFSGATGERMWTRFFSGTAHEDDRVQDLAVDAAGNVVVLGDVTDRERSDRFYLAKYAAADGAILWEQRTNGFPGSGGYGFLAIDSRGDILFDSQVRQSGILRNWVAKFSGVNGALMWGVLHGNEVRAITVDANNDVVLAGAYVSKHASANGALLWDQRFNGSARAEAVTVDPNGNVIVASLDYPATREVHTIKYAATNGAPLWEKIHPGLTNGYVAVTALTTDAAGHVLVSIQSWDTGMSLVSLAKYASADGAIRWEQRGPFSLATAQDAVGNVVVLSYASAASNTAPHLQQYAALSGALLEDRPVAHLRTNELDVDGLRVMPDGDVIAAGSSGPWGAGRMYFAARYAAGAASVIWENRAQGPGYHDADAVAVAVDPRGDVLVLSRASNGSTYDHYLSKYAGAGGALRWTYRFDGQWLDPTMYAGIPIDGAIAFDPAGNVIVTGYAFGLSGRSRYHTSKHASADGAVLWVQEPEVPHYHTEGGTQTVAVDGAGNVIVAAYSSGCPLVESYIVKHAAADGAVLWEDRCDLEEDLCHFPRTVAVDRAGNVWVVGGNTYGRPYAEKRSGVDGSLLWECPDPKYFIRVAIDADQNVILTGQAYTFAPQSGKSYVAKYAASDLRLLWEAYGDNPPNDVDSPFDSSVDNEGNVAITGTVWNRTTSNYDMFTTRFSATGMFQWRRTYNGPANSNDYARAVRFAANGNVIVTGQSADTTGWDIYTAEYAAADGALVWEKRYQGPGRGDDTQGGPRSLAVAPGGAVLVGGRSDAGFDHGQNHELVLIKYVASATISRLPADAGYRVEFPVVPGLNYTLQRATSLERPWMDLVTSQGPADGRLVHTDAAPSGVSAFYRTVTRE